MLLTEKQLEAYKEQLKGINTMKETFDTLHKAAMALYTEIAETEGEDKIKRELLESLIMNVAMVHSAAMQTAGMEECFTHNLLWLSEHEYVTPEQAAQLKEELMSPLEKMLSKISLQVQDQLESGELADQLVDGAAIIPLHPGLDVQITGDPSVQTVEDGFRTVTDPKKVN